MGWTSDQIVQEDYDGTYIGFTTEWTEWSPAFNNQSSSFTQTRNRSLNGQYLTESRTVSITTRTEPGTVEREIILGIDYNNDGDIDDVRTQWLDYHTASINGVQIATYSKVNRYEITDNPTVNRWVATVTMNHDDYLPRISGTNYIYYCTGETREHTTTGRFDISFGISSNPNNNRCNQHSYGYTINRAGDYTYRLYLDGSTLRGELILNE